MAMGPTAADSKKWMADSDLRTLIEAEKIKKDKARFAAAMKMHKEMTAALAGIDKKDGGKN
jgi:hypothetical protein